MATIKRVTKKNSKKVMSDYHSRAFLNKSEKNSNAYISIHFVDGGKYRYNDDLHINIADCDNKISLHNSFKNVDSRKNAFHKIDTLIDELTKLRNHLDLQLKELNKRGRVSRL